MSPRRADFPKACRILTAGGYRAVLKQRCQVAGRWFAVFGIPNGGEHARLGIAVSRRVSPRATERNRIKRLVREAFRHNPAVRTQALDLVVVARPACCGLEGKRLQQELTQQWQRLLIKCNKS